MTLAISRGKFARVGMEIDLNKPLRSQFRIRGKDWYIQYEGLHNFFFDCGIYNHNDYAGPGKTKMAGGESKTPDGQGSATESVPNNKESQGSHLSSFGPWMLARRVFRRSKKMVGGNSGNAQN